GSLLRRKALERRVEVPRGFARERSALGRGIVRREALGDELEVLPVAAPPDMREGRVHGAPIDPRRDRRLAAERVQRPEHREKNVLNEIVEVLVRPEDTKEGGVDPPLLALEEPPLRAPVAGHAAGDQIAVAGPGSGHGPGVCAKLRRPVHAYEG